MSMTNPIDPNMGAAFIGTVVSAVLLGVTYTQTFYYFINYPRDPWRLKSLVACTAIIDTAHQALISHGVYHYVITNFNNPPALELLVWSAILEALFGALTSFLVQCFYTVRVWRLSKSYLLTGIILLIVMANAGCGLAWVVLSMQMRTFQDLWRITPLTIAINALTSSADVLIAASLIVLLRRARTGFQRSDTIVNRLILFIVNTGVLTSVVAISILIIISASPHTLIYAAFYFCIGRLYANSFLATLNVRKHLTFGGVNDISHPLAFMPLSALSPAPSSRGKVPQNISMRIDTQTTQDRDSNSNEDDEKKHYDGLANRAV